MPEPTKQPDPKRKPEKPSKVSGGGKDQLAEKSLDTVSGGAAHSGGDRPTES